VLKHTTRLAILCSVIAIASSGGVRAAQPSPEDTEAVAHAKQLFQLLRDDKVEEFVKEFNAQMAAAATPEKIRSFMEAVRQQAGGFESFIDERVDRPQPGITAVMLGCKYEKNGVNAMFAFDAEKKLAGFSFRPRP